jgi:DNA-binding CsgD family transcriptional regulator
LAHYIRTRPGTLDAIALCPSPRPILGVLRSLGMTPRQAHVLQLLWEGATNAEIALGLGISEHTVRHHLEEIYRRLGVRSRTAAANLAGKALHADGMTLSD